MKRFSVLVTGVLVAAVSVGCSSSRKDDPMAGGERYKILSGSTSENGAQATSIEPSVNANTRFAAGRLAESQEKFDCAITQYEQALRLDPNHVPSLYRLGVVETKMKNYEAAADAWKRYIKATKEIASGYSNLGFCYEMASDIPKAEEAYKQGIDKDPKNEPCRVNYGLMLARQNRVDEAQEQLSAVLKGDEVAYNLAAIYEQQGAIAQAKAQLKQAITLNPKNTAAQQKLASLPQDIPAADEPKTPSEVKTPTEVIPGTEGSQKQQEPKTDDSVKAPTETIGQ